MMSYEKWLENFKQYIDDDDFTDEELYEMYEAEMIVEYDL